MMEFEFGNVRKPVRQLRKSLKSLPSDPAMKEVHDLRTRARHLEAMVVALAPENKKRTRRLLKTLKPVCKAAGNVRDMDVLSAKARTLFGHRRNDSVLRLLEHLQAMRTVSARELLNTVARQRKNARRDLSQFCRQIEKRFSAKNLRSAAKTTGKQPHDEAARRLIDELSRWPALNAENFHAFRIKVKELRNVLRLAGDANPEFAHALEAVKEQIGDWHDWQELKRIAEKVLGAKEDRATLKKIEEMERGKFDQARAAAYGMKKRYLGASNGFTLAEP